MDKFRWRTLEWWAKTCVVTLGFAALLVGGAALVLSLTAPDQSGLLPGFAVPLSHALFPLFVVVLISAFQRVHSTLGVRRGGFSRPQRH